MDFIMEFDAKDNLLRGSSKGRVTDAILLDSYALAARYVTSHLPCRGIWDFSEVTQFEVSSDAMRDVARRSPIIPTGHMRVLIAPQDVLFGMMRMLQILSEESRPELHVVRTVDEAYRLLRVESPNFTSVS